MELKVKKQLSQNNNFKIYISQKINTSSRPDVYCKKGVLKNFAKFSGKNLLQSLFCNKVAGLRRTTLLTKRLWHRCFLVSFAKFLKTPFAEHLRWLLLNKVKVQSLKRLFFKFLLHVSFYLFEFIALCILFVIEK